MQHAAWNARSAVRGVRGHVETTRVLCKTSELYHSRGARVADRKDSQIDEKEKDSYSR